jgi:hypothetical protein
MLTSLMIEIIGKINHIAFVFCASELPDLRFSLAEPSNAHYSRDEFPRICTCACG